MDNTLITHICQNCGTDLKGKYCYECGQKATAAYDRSIKYIFEHFVEELFVWDSRFFRSIKYILTKPGFLTHEYISGRVQKYVSPLKMFLFTSFALFFIMIKADPDQYAGVVTEDSGNIDFISAFIHEQEHSSKDSKELYINNFNSQVNDNITLYIFVIMFLFTLALALVYITKKIYMSEHIVFTLHFFTFVLWSFLISVFGADLSPFFILVFLYFLPSVYLIIAVKRVYHRTWWGALTAGTFLSVLYCTLVTVWMLGTILVSAVRAA